MRLLRGRAERRVLSVHKVAKVLEALYAEAQQYFHNPNTQGEEFSRIYRKLVSQVNSVSIVLIHFGFLWTALKLLKKAVRIDAIVVYEHSEQNRIWVHRPLIFANLSYLMMKAGDVKATLQFIFDADRMISDLLELESTLYDVFDLRIGVSLLSCLALATVQKFERAGQYLEGATVEFNLVIQQRRPTIFNAATLTNIYNLLAMCKNVIQGVPQATDYRIEANSPMRGMIEQLSHVRTNDEAIEVILSPQFRDFMFLSCFFPFIAKDTPIISQRNLNNMRRKSIRRLNLNNNGYQATMDEAIGDLARVR